MTFTTQKQPEMYIIGIPVRTSNAPDKAGVDIPNLWAKFYSENIPAKIPNKASDVTVALYTDYESDYTGAYTLILGCPVTSIDTVPEGFEARTLPEGTYAEFTCSGKPPESVLATWQTIWQQTNLNRTYIADYELYRSPEDITIFIGI